MYNVVLALTCSCRRRPGTVTSSQSATRGAADTVVVALVVGAKGKSRHCTCDNTCGEQPKPRPSINANRFEGNPRRCAVRPTRKQILRTKKSLDSLDSLESLSRGNAKSKVRSQRRRLCPRDASRAGTKAFVASRTHAHTHRRILGDQRRRILTAVFLRRSLSLSLSRLLSLCHLALFPPVRFLFRALAMTGPSRFRRGYRSGSISYRPPV